MDFFSEASYKAKQPFLTSLQKIKVTKAFANLSKIVAISSDIVFFDTETTGVKVGQDQIVSLTAIKYQHKYEEFSAIHFKCKPSIPIPAAATNIHGITNEDVEDEPPFWHFIPTVQQFLARCDIIAYNTSFDLGMLNHEFHYWLDKCSNAQPYSLPAISEYWFIGDIIDPLAIVQQKFPNWKKKTLSDAHVHLTGHTLQGAHTSAGDVLGLINLLPQMIMVLNSSAKHWEAFKYWYTIHIERGPWWTLTKDNKPTKEGQYLDHFYYSNMSLKKKYYNLITEEWKRENIIYYDEYKIKKFEKGLAKYHLNELTNCKRIKHL